MTNEDPKRTHSDESAPKSLEGDVAPEAFQDTGTPDDTFDLALADAGPAVPSSLPSMVDFDLSFDEPPAVVETRALEHGIEQTDNDKDNLTFRPGSGEESNADNSSFKIPEYVAGYELISELGRGGMGVVFRARDTQLRRDVAIKMILSGELAGQKMLQRFKTEAEAVARLQHPNVVQIFDVGWDEDRPYIVLEFVDGPDLAEQIKETPLLPRQAAQVILTLAEATQYAHDRNVLHRDLKPSNVLVAPDGTLKISDFGLAKHLDEDASAKTTTGDILGTPSYMAPEQASGHSNSIGPATDQYALGSMLYALITGRPPFLSAKPIDTVSKVINDEPMPPGKMVSELPCDLETICLKTLQKKPEQRYSSCQTLADDLRRFLNDEPITARPISATERTWRWCKRNPRIAIPSSVAAGLLFALITLGTISYGMITKQKDRAEANLVLAETNEAIAIESQKLAEASEAIAQQREADARAQAVALMKNVQYVLTDVDPALAKQPGSTELRLAIAEHQAKVWNKIDAAIRDDEQSEAVPTLLGVRFRLGGLFEQLGKIEQSKEQLNRAVELARRRIVVKQNSDASRLNLVKVLLRAAGQYDRFGRDIEASMQLKKEALATVQSILDDPKPEVGSPSLYSIHEVNAECLQRIAAAVMSKGQLDESKKLIMQALEIRKENLGRLPKTNRYLEAEPAKQKEMMAESALTLDRSTMGVAYTMVKEGQTDDGLRLFESVVQSRKKAYQANSEIPSLRREYAGFAGLLGDCLMWNGQMNAAREKYDASFEVQKKFYEDNPLNIDRVRKFASAAYRRGCLNGLAGNDEASTTDMQTSFKLRQEIVTKANGEKDQMDLCLAMAWLGMAEQAKPILEGVAELEKPDSEIQLKSARAWSSLARNSKGPRKVEYRALATKSLERAIKEGYSDSFKVKVEPEFQWLKDSDDFKQLVNSIK